MYWPDLDSIHIKNYSNAYSIVSKCAGFYNLLEGEYRSIAHEFLSHNPEIIHEDEVKAIKKYPGAIFGLMVAKSIYDAYDMDSISSVEGFVPGSTKGELKAIVINSRGEREDKIITPRFDFEY